MDADDESPIEPIPDIVERLKVYSRDSSSASGPEEPAVAPEVGTADVDETVGDEGPPATRTVEGD